MNSENTRFALIEDYLNGTLSGAERTAFEEQLRFDTELAEDLELHRSVNNLIIDRALLNLKAKMVTEYRPRFGDEPPKGHAPWRLIALVGLVSLSLLVGGLRYLSRQTPALGPVTAETLSPVGNAPSALPTLPTPASGTSLSSKKPASRKRATPLSAPSVGQDSISRVLTVPTLSSEKGLIPLAQPILPKPLASDTQATLPPVLRAIPLPASDACAHVRITMKVNLQESCADFPTGKLSYDSRTVQGGVPPYQFSLNGGTTFTSGDQFEHLAPGTYYLMIQDSQGCRYTLPEAFEVPSVPCQANQEHAFAPDRGETWVFPFDERAQGTLRIYNRAGVLVYSVAIHSGFPREWNGQGSQGVPISMGSYHFTFEAENGKVTRGTLSVVR